MYAYVNQLCELMWLKSKSHMQKRINVWSSPRNISTAFMYSFAQRKDMTVVDEPLYAHFLLNTTTKAKHPGTQEILDTMENDGAKVVDTMLHQAYTTPHVLFKQMTHHLIELNENFLFEMDNILLIRDPKRILASYVKIVENPAMHDVGIKMQYDLFKKLEAAGKVAAVVDAKQLLLHPQKVLTQLCQKVGLSFDDHMLQWKKGSRSEDGCWAKYWYANVHNSTGFQPYVEKDIQLFGNLAALASKCQPYYEYLFQYAIKA